MTGCRGDKTPPQSPCPPKDKIADPYREHNITHDGILQDPHAVQILGESGMVFVDVSDVDHNCGHVTEGGRAFPAALNGQEVFGACLKVRAPVDVQYP